MSLTWINEYVEARRVEGLADNTVKVLHWKLKLLAEWARRRCGEDLRRLTPAKLEAFSAWLMTRRRVERGANRGRLLSPSYARDATISVRRFLAWLTESGRLLVNPAARVDPPRPVHILPRGILTRREIGKLLASPNARTAEGERDKAILELLYGAGIRGRELYNLDMGDVDLARGVVFVRRGKGAKDRVVPTGSRAADTVSQYLSRARPRLVSSPVESALFVDGWGKRLTGGFINRRMRLYTRRCGIKRRVTAHAIRHTLATHMLENGADVRTVQEMLGHADIDSTQIYTRVSIPHLREVHRRTHPRARRRAKALTASAA